MATFPTGNSRRMKGLRPWAWVLILALCLGLAACGDSGEAPKSDKAVKSETPAQSGATAQKPDTAQPKVKISLRPTFVLVAHYDSAGPQGRAALSLWLRPARGGGSPVEAPDWSRALSIIPQGGEAEGQGIKLVSAPEAQTLAPGKNSVYHAVYELSPPSRPQPASQFSVRLKIGQGSLNSGPIKAPADPVGEGQALRRQARVARVLGDAQALVEAGQKLAEAEPASPDGPFFIGQGRQAKKDYQGALDAYWSALKLAQALPRTPASEPPTPIIRRIKLMRWLIEKQKGQTG